MDQREAIEPLPAVFEFEVAHEIASLATSETAERVLHRTDLHGLRAFLSGVSE
jgi:hypothetical protein